MAFGSDSTGTILNNFRNARADLNKSSERLSSGLRINRAVDDAAGLAIAAGLDASIRSLSQASRNVSDTESAFLVADSSLEQISNITGRLSELAAESANGTLSDTQRTSLQQEFSALTQEIQRIGGTTEFNGKNLFDGQALTAQVGTDSDPDSQITAAGIDISALTSGLASLNIGTAAGASGAIDQVSDLSAQISSVRGSIGAVQSRFSSASASISARSTAESSALKEIRDADFATELSNKVSADIRSQAGVATLAQVNKVSVDLFRRLFG